MELRKSGISCMSDLYSLIYIVDLLEDKITPVWSSEEDDKERPKDLGANDQFTNLFNIDAEEKYKDNMVRFSNLTTLVERLRDRNSTTMEYVSKNYGWCRVTFIAMDRNENGDVDRVLFTIQLIDDEKRELERIMGKLESVESEERARNLFLGHMANEIRRPVGELVEYNNNILSVSKEKSVVRNANNIKELGKLLLFTVDNILDYFHVNAGQIRLSAEEYSLKEILEDIKLVTRLRLSREDVEFKLDVSPDVPDLLYGDPCRLKQVLINLIANATGHMKAGEITLTVYCKKLEEGRVHLLFSVKNKESGMVLRTKGISDEELAKRKEYRYLEEANIGVILAEGLLELMGSKLGIAPIQGESNNMYFEIEQQIHKN
ncbi:MAG: HAMP domain-containing histidine kinase [Eubacterium sp.]|nr:HAMP domain-containing histidine kinase [Eubacterium sp.]